MYERKEWKACGFLWTSTNDTNIREGDLPCVLACSLEPRTRTLGAFGCEIQFEWEEPRAKKTLLAILASQNRRARNGKGRQPSAKSKAYESHYT